MCPTILNTTSPHLLPHPIPLCCPRVPVLGILHVVIRTFQGYSLISSHPCLLPHIPKVCSLPLCLFCCLSYKVVITIFLNSISSVQSLSCVQLFVTPWTAACQASLSITNFWSLLKLMSIESVMPSNKLILFSPSPPTVNLSQHQGIFK